MPRGMRARNNFVQVRVAFYVAYCWREGIFLSSNLAREVLIYIFKQRRLHNASKRAGAKAKHDHLRGRYGFEKGCVGLLKTSVSVF